MRVMRGCGLCVVVLLVACATAAPVRQAAVASVAVGAADEVTGFVVTQEDGRGGGKVAFEGMAGESAGSVTVTASVEGVLTGWSAAKNEDGELEVDMRFDGVPGLVSVTVKNGSFSKVVEVAVRGIGVRGAGFQGIVSGVVRRGIVLGDWGEWVGELRWFVVPLVSFGVDGGPVGAAVQLRQIVGRNAGQATNGGVEAVDLNGRGSVCTFELGAGNNARVYGPEGVVRKGGVVAQQGCGVAVSGDGGLMAVRIEKYLVGSGAWQIVLAKAGLFSVLNCWFERGGPVPPVVLRGGLPTLDPYGGEIVELEGVRNLFKPPRANDLQPQDVAIAVYNGEKEVGRESALRIERVGSVGTLVFRTAVVKDGLVTDTKLLFRERGTTGNFLVAALVRQAGEGEQEVVFVDDGLEDNDEGSVFAAGELAEKGECDNVFNDTSVGFTVVRLSLPLYKSDRFSMFKAKQIGDAIAVAVGVNSSAVRFFDFEDDTKTGVYEVAGGGAAQVVAQSVSTAVSDGSIADAARLDDQDISFENAQASGEESLICAEAASDDGGIIPREEGILEGDSVVVLPWLIVILTIGLFTLMGIVGVGCTRSGCFGKQITMSTLLSRQTDRGSSITSSSSVDPRRMTDRQRAESFGLHQGEDSRRRERIAIQPDSESEISSSRSPSNWAGSRRASELEESDLVSPWPEFFDDDTGSPARWPGSLRASAVDSDLTRATATGASTVHARYLYPQSGLSRENYEEYDDLDGHGYSTTSGLYSESDGGSETYEGPPSAASSRRRMSREERATGYAARSDPLVARLTYALRTARGAGNGDLEEDDFVARDGARLVQNRRIPASPSMMEQPRPRPSPAVAEYWPEEGNTSSNGSGNGSGSGGRSTPSPGASRTTPSPLRSPFSGSGKSSSPESIIFDFEGQVDGGMGGGSD